MWQRLSEVGPLYPGVGWEIPLTVVVCGLWFGWTVWQVRHENAEYDERVRQLRGCSLDAPTDARGASRTDSQTDSQTGPTAGTHHGSKTS